MRKKRQKDAKTFKKTPGKKRAKKCNEINAYFQKPGKNAKIKRQNVKKTPGKKSPKKCNEINAYFQIPGKNAKLKTPKNTKYISN